MTTKKRAECYFCEGRKEILINKEADVFFPCPKCDGVGDIFTHEDGGMSVIEDEIDIKANIKKDKDGREKLRTYARRKYNDNTRSD